MAGHVLGTLLTIAAPSFAVLFAATLVIGIANGLVEAFANPLVATLFPEQKTTRLVAFHAWFPGGIVIGGVLSYLFSQAGLGWQAKMLMLLVPTAAYAFMFAGQQFPATEGKAAGVTLGGAFKEIGRPLFLVVWLCMWLTAATELGPGQWYANIFNDVMGSGTQTGIILLVWVNGIMYLVRQFFGHVPHRVSPTLLIAVTAPLAAAGLYLFGWADVAGDVVRRGGAAGHRHRVLVADHDRHHLRALPARRRLAARDRRRLRLDRDRDLRTGDGEDQRQVRCAAVLPTWAVLPVVLTIVFALLYAADRSRGGYRVERL